MKGRILIFGSIIAVVILVLASFPSVVNAQSTTSIGKIINSEIVDGENANKQNSILYNPPGWYLRLLWDFFLSIIVWFYINIWANIGN